MGKALRKWDIFLQVTGNHGSFLSKHCQRSILGNNCASCTEECIIGNVNDEADNSSLEISEVISRNRCLTMRVD